MPGVPDCVPVATYVVPIVHDVPHVPDVAALPVVHVVPNITFVMPNVQNMNDVPDVPTYALCRP